MDQDPRQRYEAICEASPDAIVVADRDGRITYANGRVTDLFGYDPSELVGEPIETLVPEAARAGHVAKRDAYIADPETRPMGAGLDLSGRRKDGSEIPIDISLSPIESGGRCEVMAAVRDVRDRETLRAKYQTILEAVPDAVVVADAATGDIVEVNERAGDLLGYEPCDLVGRPQTVLHPSGEADRYRALFEEYVAGPSSDRSILHAFPDGADIHVETSGGERIPVEINAHVFDLYDRRLIAGVFRDVTDRKEYQRQLRTLHSATRQLIAADGREEIAALVADAARTILGYEYNVVRLADDDRLRPAAVTDGAETEMGDRPMYPIDGSAPVSRVYDSGESLRFDDVRALEDGYDRGDARSAMYHPMGDHGVISVVDPAVGTFDPSDEELASVLSVNAEIALNRLSYERDLERQNERLDEFASVVAHDLRNPLNVAQGLLEGERTGVVATHGDEIAAALDRMEGIVDDVLTMVRDGYEVDDAEPLEFDTIVADCWDCVATADATLRVESDGLLYADSSRIRNLFENLFRNAVEHGGPDVTVTVALSEGGFAVADDGPGIPLADRDRVLEPGWTTGENGTGLGLNIVREIARAHDWGIDVTESAAGGARFEFTGVRTVPAADAFEADPERL
ncbi:PAS domain S-box protein [Natrinema thermotolerans]|uniref:histidine kinase n=1 Tax=Natrinema thermotolerans TaxID=121872 RepID=A0AAF0P845_9EURY|nr:PAS domain S-box protein [Natrinema thermotolerans]QCC59181.1 PAS domain S-box protein [Natrinema thermotolerans]WMT06141.1 PAS domain S-box protein [Natrinema thermotolerans]